MNLEELLTETHRRFLAMSLGVESPNLIDEIAVPDIMGYGTTLDEKIHSLDALSDLIARQQEQSAGMQLTYSATPTLRRIFAGGHAAAFADDLKLTLTVGDVVVPLLFRVTVTYEYRADQWKAIHWHGSKPENVESQQDTFGIEEWKHKADELEKLVAERTTELATKNRDLEIEAALERVRTRTMAMHQSIELAEAASVLFQQIKDLGYEMWSCGFCIWKQDDFSELWMSADSGGLLPPMLMPYKEEPTHHKIYQASLRQEAVHEYVWEGEELKKHYEFLYTIPSVKAAIDILEKSGLSLPAKQCYYVGFFNQGYLLIITKEPTPEMHELSYRFTHVFEQTYTRFLDLQKSEAQAREAQVEVALERVRARTMTMQTSEELSATAAEMFRQIQALGLSTWSCGFNIIETDRNQITQWVCTADGRMLPSFKTPSDEDIFFRFTEAARKGESFYVESMSEEALEAHYTYLNSLPEIKKLLDDFKESAITPPRFQVFNVAYFSYGYLLFITYNTAPEFHAIFERFSTVFDQTYTRFLDLQKAEAQAELTRQNLILIQSEKQRAEDALTELKITQTQLIQKEKLASLGELTAGIAHEIQNPLNFVNNFSEVSTELVDELVEEQQKLDRDADLETELLSDLRQNLQKITQHGQRASSIVKGMLEHSRTSTGERQSTDLNALADEYLRLAYQGLKAKDKTVNVDLLTHFDPDLGLIEVVPQEIGRVLLNLYNNAFYAVKMQQKTTPSDYQPRVMISTSQVNGSVAIRVQDNGTGIADTVKAKIFQPFFTTKPTGDGTGLGLSLSYDIITKGHGGTLAVESQEGQGTEFVIQLPLKPITS